MVIIYTKVDGLSKKSEENQCPACIFMKLLLQHPLICSEQNDLEAGSQELTYKLSKL
ncbi:hypothetical protein NC651_030815 [Populus alba x Populus x berolinensis]|nr:hypothetical protein NC651_030815 [Populus alba x Populus x berolinensis]